MHVAGRQTAQKNHRMRAHDDVCADSGTKISATLHRNRGELHRLYVLLKLEKYPLLG